MSDSVCHFRLMEMLNITKLVEYYYYYYYYC